MNTLGHETASPAMKQESQALEEAAQKALARRLASGAVLTYELDGWVVEEHPRRPDQAPSSNGEVSGGGVPLPGLHAACSLRRLIVYAGANGAGKSTLRDAAADAVDVEIDADRIARQINPANPRAADVVAAREALRLFNHALREGRSLSFETTLASHTVLGRIRAAKHAGYKIALRYIALNDVEENVRRVEPRPASTGSSRT